MAKLGFPSGEEGLIEEDLLEYETGQPGLGSGQAGPGSGFEGEPGEGSPPATAGAERVIGDADVLAAEVLSDKRLLSVLLSLVARPSPASKLVESRVLVRTRRKVRERDQWSGRVRERVEEREEYRAMPASTMYRVLARLRRAGLVEVYRGLDARRRYYRLSPLGRGVAARVLEALAKLLGRKAVKAEKLGVKDKPGWRALEWKRFDAKARELGVEPRLLAEALGLETIEGDYDKYVLIPPPAQAGERIAEEKRYR